MAKPKKLTKKYGRVPVAGWKPAQIPPEFEEWGAAEEYRELFEEQAAQDRETSLSVLENARSTIVSDIRKGKNPHDMAYSMGRDVLSQLEGNLDAPFPEIQDYGMLPVEEQARTMQRLLTELSHQFDPVEIPPPPQGGGGGGNNNNQQQQQQGQGQGGGGQGKGGGQQKPQQGQGQGQGGQGQPQRQRQGQQQGGGQQPQQKQPQQQQGQGQGGGQQKQQGQGQQQGGGQQPAPAKPAPPSKLTSGYSNAATMGEDGPPPEGTPTAGVVPGGPNGGYGLFLGEPEDLAMFWAIRDIIKKLAYDTDWSETQPEGSERWNVGRLVRAYYDPGMVRGAKEDYGTTVDNIYLVLDTSGSVSSYTSMIASLAGGAAGLVHLYHGEEGHPLHKVVRKTPLRYPAEPFPEWTELDSQESLPDDPGYREWIANFREKWGPLYPELLNHIGWHHGASFEENLAYWLEREKIPEGSVLLFWGDTQVVDFAAPELLKQLVAPYKFCWLFPYTEDQVRRNAPYIMESFENGETWFLEQPRKYQHWEYFKLLLLGLPVLMDIRTAESLRAAMRDIIRVRSQKGL